MGNNELINDEIKAIFLLFFNEIPVEQKIIDTSRGEEDFRNAVIISTQAGNRYVLKITENDFTSPEKIRVWKRTIEEYRNLGYYCPLIYNDKNNDYPTVSYKGHNCIVYAEEYSKYKSLEDREDTNKNGEDINTSAYIEDIWTMTAKVADKNFDYAGFPSAYCLFETFCPGDKTDEVMENALDWKKCASSLPEVYSERVERIWRRWNENREKLQPLYKKLPTSVFQADLNSTNLLVDDSGIFKGVYDFNLCGRDVFINYLMRECFDDFDKEVEHIRQALKISSRYYRFSDEEKEIALPLFRCLKPLWFMRIEELEEAGNDPIKIGQALDHTEYYLTADIDFKSCMG